MLLTETITISSENQTDIHTLFGRNFELGQGDMCSNPNWLIIEDKNFLLQEYYMSIQTVQKKRKKDTKSFHCNVEGTPF
jgi:hypothetical protein